MIFHSSALLSLPSQLSPKLNSFWILLLVFLCLLYSYLFVSMLKCMQFLLPSHCLKIFYHYCSLLGQTYLQRYNILWNSVLISLVYLLPRFFTFLEYQSSTFSLNFLRSSLDFFYLIENAFIYLYFCLTLFFLFPFLLHLFYDDVWKYGHVGKVWCMQIII